MVTKFEVPASQQDGAAAETAAERGPRRSESGCDDGSVDGAVDSTVNRTDKLASDGTRSLPREYGGRKGPEPTRYGDWEKNGRCIDF
jgi:hypothetical protein